MLWNSTGQSLLLASAKAKTWAKVGFGIGTEFISSRCATFGLMGTE